MAFKRSAVRSRLSPPKKDGLPVLFWWRSQGRPPRVANAVLPLALNLINAFRFAKSQIRSARLARCRKRHAQPTAVVSSSLVSDEVRYIDACIKSRLRTACPSFFWWRSALQPTCCSGFVRRASNCGRERAEALRRPCFYTWL